MDRLDRAALKTALGEQPTEDLPMIAAWALTDGLGSPALAELAGLSRRDPPADIRDLFVQAMAELGRPLPGAEDAWRERMLEAARSMLSGSVMPYEASSEIYWCAWRREEMGIPSESVAAFLGLWSGWEDWPDQRDAIEREMRLAAAALLRSHGEQVPE